ncbi:MAG: tol-pal system-associated acyl-CoA thioesterase [Proteobacteria bacterium]|nr:tol-pal system-associated acyl-CoA thioesterase [Pseudomonadota bacterium]MBI3496515.1 tol-pal system-associated acyl-CoA thioesterase [Pseudomonadota bacterium]
MPERQHPSAGSLEGGVHRFPIRVYYEDTDAAGVVYHGNYLKYAERARTEMMRGLGLSHSELASRLGLVFTVRRCEIDYRAPARLDDELQVATRILEVGGARLMAEQTITRAGGALARLVLTLACVTAAGRPARLPNDLRSAIAAAFQ